MYFKEFVKNSVVTNQGVKILNEGIDHIESLPLNTFISTIKKLSTFIATEKLDGSNLVFGIDNNNKFYTSREGKEGKQKIYSSSKYENKAANNGFKSAHEALQKSIAQLKQILNAGDAVEVEILYGRQPNAIVYGSNYIAFLRMVPGDNKEHPDQKKIKQLADIMKGKSVTVTTSQQYTEDGIDIKTKKVNQKWKFASTSYVESHQFAKVDVRDELKKLQTFLKTKNKAGNLGLTNMDIIGINLTTVPKTIRPEVKKARTDTINIIDNKFKLPIKEKFLNEILRKLQPALRDVDVESYEETGIEGVVVLDPKTLQQYKIVDKDMFTMINKFNHAIRNEIKLTSTGTQKMDASIIKDGDIFGNMLKQIASAIGMPKLGKYIDIKRIIRKYTGDNKEETLSNFVNEFKEKNTNALKRKVSSAINDGLTNLTDGLNKYNNEWKSYTTKLKTGKEIKYTKSVHNRTLLTFAEVRQEMLKMLKGVKNAKNISDIAVSLFGKQLKSIH